MIYSILSPDFMDGLLFHIVTALIQAKRCKGTALSHSDRAESSNFLSLEHAIMYNMYIRSTV